MTFIKDTCNRHCFRLKARTVKLGYEDYLEVYIKKKTNIIKEIGTQIN